MPCTAVRFEPAGAMAVEVRTAIARVLDVRAMFMERDTMGAWCPCWLWRDEYVADGSGSVAYGGGSGDPVCAVAAAAVRDNRLQ